MKSLYYTITLIIFSTLSLCIQPVNGAQKNKELYYKPSNGSWGSVPTLIDHISGEKEIDQTIDYLRSKKTDLDQIIGLEKIYARFCEQQCFKGNDYKEFTDSVNAWLNDFEYCGPDAFKKKLFLVQECCRQGFYIAFCLLMDVNSDDVWHLISTPDFFGWNALHLAVSCGSIDLVQKILDIAQDYTSGVHTLLVAQSKNNKVTPLHCAMMCPESATHVQITRILRNAAISYAPEAEKIKNAYGQTPADSMNGFPNDSTDITDKKSMFLSKSQGKKDKKFKLLNMTH